MQPKIRSFAVASLFLWIALLNPTVNSFATPTPIPSPMSKVVWGHCKTIAIRSTTTAPTIQRELQDMWDDGGRVVRIDVDAAVNWGYLHSTLNAARAIGFTNFVLIYYANLTWTTIPTPTAFANGAVSLAQAHPDCMIELSNEPNLHAVSAAQYAALAKAAYQAIKAAGLPNTVLLGGIGNSNSTVGNLSMLDWCKKLVANECVRGQAFDWANYHDYGKPSANEPWWHIFTPNSSGESCQSVFGNPPFAFTEFGASLSKDCGGSETVQAQYITDWMVLLKRQPQFRLGCQYAMADEAPGSGTGYGLRRLNLTRRPSWDSYKTQAAGAGSASPTPWPPSNLRIM